MTLDEAIKHCLEVAEKEEQFCVQDDRSCLFQKSHAECAADHRQLAEWLTELKQWRRVYGICPSYEMCIPECKEGYNAQIKELEAKHWDECRQIAHYDNDIKSLKAQIAEFKRCVKSDNSDYLTGYISALSAVEGMIDKLIGGSENG